MESLGFINHAYLKVLTGLNSAYIYSVRAILIAKRCGAAYLLQIMVSNFVSLKFAYSITSKAIVEWLLHWKHVHVVLFMSSLGFKVMAFTGDCKH